MPRTRQDQPRGERGSEYMRGGKGRKDDVRGSRIFPASSPDAPANAEVRSEADLVRHASPRRKPFKRAI